MIIPKNTVGILKCAIENYIRKYSATTRELEFLRQVQDKCDLVIHGDATGLEIEQVYTNRITTIVPCKECHEHPCACSLLEDNELTGLQDISWKKN